MSYTAVVVFRESSIEGGNALIVRSLHFSQESRVQSTFAFVSINARVDNDVVARLDICQEIRDTFASVHIHELQLDMHWYASLSLGNVRSYVCSRNIVGTNDCLGNESTGVVGAEYGRLRGVERTACRCKNSA